MNTGLFIPCFVDQLYPDTAFSMIKVLEKADEVARTHMRFDYNPGQSCCGQVAFNGGFWDEAKQIGEKFIRDFREYDYVVGPSASCIGFIKNYYQQMFYNSALHNENNYLARKIFELTDFIVNILKVDDLGASFDTRICFHDSCTAAREYGLSDQPRRLLEKVRGLEIVEMKKSEECCGFGGTFSVKFEAISTAMAEQKTANAIDTGAEYIVSTETSCLMHLQAYIDKQGLPLKTLHIADLLARGLENN